MTPREFATTVNRDIAILSRPVLPLVVVSRAYSTNPSVPHSMSFPVYRDALGRFWYENTHDRSLSGPFRQQKEALFEAEMDIGGYDFS